MQFNPRSLLVAALSLASVAAEICIDVQIEANYDALTASGQIKKNGDVVCTATDQSFDQNTWTCNPANENELTVDYNNLNITYTYNYAINNVL